MRILFGIIGLWWVGSSMYVLDERNMAVVTMFGEAKEAVKDPGLKWKLPWPLNRVHRFDKRAQLLEVETLEAFTKDTKNLVLTPFVLWKITDPILFLERVSTVKQAAHPISELVTSRIGSAMGQIAFSSVLSIDGDQKRLLPETLLNEINEQTARFGISVEHLELQRLNLPVQNEQSIYERMRAERSRIAEKYRAEGKEEATKIRAQADNAATKIRTDAEIEAATAIAKSEREIAELYTTQYSRSPELYQLLRDLESVEATLTEGGTVVLSSKDRPFSTFFSTEGKGQ